MKQVCKVKQNEYLLWDSMVQANGTIYISTSFVFPHVPEGPENKGIQCQPYRPGSVCVKNYSLQHELTAACPASNEVCARGV